MNTNKIYTLECPHCYGTIQIQENQINCSIFRHAIWKDPQKEAKTPFNPHAPKKECDRALQNGEILGCGKPFKFKYINKTTRKGELIACDYV